MNYNNNNNYHRVLFVIQNHRNNNKINWAKKRNDNCVVRFISNITLKLMKNTNNSCII